MHASAAAIAAQGCSPIIRIPAPENWLVKRALDTGGMFPNLPYTLLVYYRAANPRYSLVEH